MQYNKKELETYVGTLHGKLLKDEEDVYKRQGQGYLEQFSYGAGGGSQTTGRFAADRR